MPCLVRPALLLLLAFPVVRSVAGDWTTITTVSTVHWSTRPPPRLRLAVFFRLRLRVSHQNTAKLPNPDSLTHPGTNNGGGQRHRRQSQSDSQHALHGA